MSGIDPEDEARFRRLFETTYPKLVAYARRRSFDRSGAEDAVSEVYTTAWRRRDELAPGKDPLPWLYGIAGNVLRNQWRADSRRLQLVDKLEAQPRPVVPDPSDVIDGGPVALRAALRALSFDDSEVLRLVAWEGLSHAEVGQVLECSTNAVGIRIHRARQRLEEQLKLDAARQSSTSENHTNHTDHNNDDQGGQQ